MFLKVANFLFLLVVGAISFVGATTEVTAEEPVGVPKICNGYDATSDTWGIPALNAEGKRVCSANRALLAVSRVWARRTRPEEIGLIAVCCPLPSNEILTSNHVWVDTTCPEDSVATGYEYGSLKPDGRYTATIRCTSINLERYVLGKVTSGAFWGVGSSAAFPWKEDIRLLRTSIPVAVRYGIERVTRASRIHRGCIGTPIGSLFVGKTGKSCKDMQFRQLFHREDTLHGNTPLQSFSKGDRSFNSGSSTPVTIFPKCRQLTSIFARDPECIH